MTAGNRDHTATYCRFLTGKSSGGGWAGPELRAFARGWEPRAGWALSGGMGFVKAEANGQGARGPGGGREPQNRAEPNVPGTGPFPAAARPALPTVPGQPAPSSIDESNITINCICLSPQPPPSHPWPAASTSPSSGGGGCPSSGCATSYRQPAVLVLA